MFQVIVKAIFVCTEIRIIIRNYIEIRILRTAFAVTTILSTPRLIAQFNLLLRKYVSMYDCTCFYEAAGDVPGP